MSLIRVFALVLSAVLLTGCAQKILKNEPVGGSIPSNEIVYVENDGRCDSGQVIQITGGNNRKGIPRKYDCVARPE